MTSPAVAAIQQVALKHVSKQLNLSQQLQVMKRMYLEQDWMWIQTMTEMERQVAEEAAAARAVAGDARAIAMEERMR